MISDMTSEGNRAAAGSVQPIATSTSFNPPLRISARDPVNEILKKAFEDGNFDAIQTACKKGDLVLIEAIHKVNQSILSKPIGEDGSVALHFAASHGRKNVLNFLIQQYPETRAIKNKFGHTFLEVIDSALINEFKSLRDAIDVACSDPMRLNSNKFSDLELDFYLSISRLCPNIFNEKLGDTDLRSLVGDSYFWSRSEPKLARLFMEIDPENFLKRISGFKERAIFFDTLLKGKGHISKLAFSKIDGIDFDFSKKIWGDFHKKGYIDSYGNIKKKLDGKSDEELELQIVDKKIAEKVKNAFREHYNINKYALELQRLIDWKVNYPTDSTSLIRRGSLSFAVVKRDLPMVRFLIKAKVDVNDDQDYSILWGLVNNGKRYITNIEKEIVKALIIAGADFNAGLIGNNFIDYFHSSIIHQIVFDSRTADKKKELLPLLFLGDNVSDKILWQTIIFSIHSDYYRTGIASLLSLLTITELTITETNDESYRILYYLHRILGYLQRRTLYLWALGLDSDGDAALLLSKKFPTMSKYKNFLNNLVISIIMLGFLKNDADIWNAYVHQNGLRMQNAPDCIKENKQVVLSAVNNNGQALQYVSDTLRDNDAVVEAAVKNTPSSLQFASIRLRSNPSFIQIANDQVKKSMRVINHHYHDLFMSSPLLDNIMEFAQIESPPQER